MTAMSAHTPMDRHPLPQVRHFTTTEWDADCAATVRAKIKARSVDSANGCWNWTGGVDTHGYGQLRVAGKMALAHRASYRAFIGPIPIGLTIDHLCRNIVCVNPAHMEPVTAVENIKRRPAKTHCPSGHEYAGSNLYLHPNGSPVCRACQRAAAARFYARKRAA